MDSKNRKLFNILITTPPDQWATRLGDYPDGVLEQFMQQVKLHSDQLDGVVLRCLAVVYFGRRSRSQ